MTPLLLLKMTVPDARLLPAAENATPLPAPPVYEAVIVEPLSPKLIPLLLEKTSEPFEIELLEAEKVNAAPNADAVMTLPFIPKLTLFELLNTIVPDAWLLPAPEIATPLPAPPV